MDAACAQSFQSLEQWQTIAPAEEPTENMMKWMRHFEQPCHLLCCRAPDCASIQCLFCRKSLTSAMGAPPALRFECAECQPVGSESFTTGTVVIVSATTMCSDCFHDGRVAAHRHSARFLRVDEAGRHTVTSRPVPPSPVRELLIQDFAPVLDQQGQCPICGDDFSAQSPAVSAALCRKGHGAACNRDSDGRMCAPYDSRSFFCGECSLSWAKEKGLQFYDNPDALCSVCVHDNEMARWKAEFEKERREADAGDCREARAMQLKDIHRQPWIQAVVDEVFGV